MGNIAAHASIPGIAPVGANSFKKDIFIDFLMMTGLFLTSFFSVYFIQGVFNYLFFLLPRA
ncbi:hypothetical protein HGB07_04460 [Candidatus Roizmanbacteria bacterium]|nr:hypothetical protein [Candidatus Roizmanbacteria bacterium]